MPDIKDLMREFVVGAADGFPSLFKSVLPQYADPMTKAYGQDLWDRMLKDPVVQSSIEARKLAVLADGISLLPAVEHPVDAASDPEQAKDAERASELKEFVERALVQSLDDAELSFYDVALTALDALQYGHKIAEKVLAWGKGRDAGRLIYSAIKPRDSRLVSFIIDEYENVLGLSAAKLENAGAIGPRPYHLANVEKLRSDPTFVERSKFFIFRNRGKNSDPRGLSVLCSAYNAWYIKTQVWPEYYKYLKQFGTPIVVGKTGDGAGDEYERDEAGQVKLSNGKPIQISAQAALLHALLGLLNASVVVVPHGAEIELRQSQGDGVAFLNANDYFDRQITLAISGTTRLTLEAKHGSKADTDTALDVAGLRIANDKLRLARAINRDIIRPIIRLNYGEEAVRLSPVAALSQTEQQDLANMWRAVASLETSGALDDSMRTAVYVKAGLPRPDLEARRKAAEERSAIERLRAGSFGKLLDPSIDTDEEAA